VRERQSSHRRNVTGYHTHTDTHTHTHTHTHARLSRSVCLAANIIMVLTALVNSSTQNKLSGSVGASSGEFHSKVCVLLHVCVCVCVCVLSLSLNYDPLFQPLHKHTPYSQLNPSSTVKMSTATNSKVLSRVKVTFEGFFFFSRHLVTAQNSACLSLRCGPICVEMRAIFEIVLCGNGRAYQNS